MTTATDIDLFFMQQALAQAVAARRAGEVPIGAVITKDGKLLASEHNRVIAQHDPSAHAEIMVLRAAARTLKNYRLVGTTLYVTLEPCAMCYTALVHARIARLVFAATDEQRGAVVGAIRLAEHLPFNHSFQVTGGVLAEQSSALLDDFFKARR